MVNITSLLNQGGSIMLGVSPDDLKMLAESVVECHEASRRKQQEDAKSAESETYITTREACDMLQVCEGTLITWSKRGYLVPHKVGRKNRYALSDVKRILYGDRGNTVTAYCKRKAKGL